MENPDKIWEFNNSKCKLKTKDKEKSLNGNPKKNIEEIIQNFNFDTPQELPPICALLSIIFHMILLDI